MPLVDRKAGRILEEKRELVKRGTEENNRERRGRGGVGWVKRRKRKGGGQRKVGHSPGGPMSGDSHYLPPWIPKSPPTVFISSSLILLFSAVNLLSLFSPLFSRIPRHLHYFLISSFGFATSLPAAFFFFFYISSVPLWCHSVDVLLWIRVDSTVIISMQNGNLSTGRGAIGAFWRCIVHCCW